MNEMIAFLRAQLEEDERCAGTDDRFHNQVAHTLACAGKMNSTGWEPRCRCTVPDRVLREVEAKRAIVEMHSGEHECQEIREGTYPPDWPPGASYGAPGASWRHAFNEHFEGPCPTIRHLAAVYSDHPDYREDWRL